jgi:hypothetical protein
MKARSVNLARYRRDLEARGLRPTLRSAPTCARWQSSYKLSEARRVGGARRRRNYVVALQRSCVHSLAATGATSTSCCSTGCRARCSLWGVIPSGSAPSSGSPPCSTPGPAISLCIHTPIASSPPTACRSTARTGQIPERDLLFPLAVLAKLFRGKFLAGLARSRRTHGVGRHLSADDFETLVDSLYKIDWNI